MEGSPTLDAEKQLEILRSLRCGFADIPSAKHLLANLIPELKTLLPSEPTDSAETRGGPALVGSFRFERLKNALVVFFMAISKIVPLTVFIDDLQWADAASLDIYNTLLEPGGISGKFLFVGSYRDNELRVSHPLWAHMNKLEGLRCSTRVHVKDLALPSLNSFLASLLRYDDEPDKTQRLAKSVFRRTHGNIFYTIQFIQMLIHEEILYFTFVNMKWEWDVAKLENETAPTGNVVELVIARMRRLSQETALALVICSQLGNRFYARVVSTVLYRWKRPELKPSTSDISLDSGDDEGEDERAPEYLQVLLDEGFIVPLECKKRNWYRFHHDRIQQAAAGLVKDECEMTALRLRLGTQIAKLSKTLRQPWAVLSAADILNFVADSLFSEREPVLDLVLVNMEAAEIASSQSAFSSAANYLEMSRNLLGKLDPPWGPELYPLTLKTYTMAAEMEFSRGDLKKCQTLVKEVCLYATSTKDKLVAMYVLVTALGSKGKYNESIDLAYEALNEAGLPMPTGGAKPEYFEKLFAQVMAALEAKPDNDILTLPPDPFEGSNEIILKLLCPLILFAWHGNRLLDHAVVACRMMLHTLQHGLSEYSGLACGLLGISCCMNNKFEVARRLYHLRLKPQIKDLSVNKETEGATLCVGYIGSGHLFATLTTVTDEVLRGYKAAMMSGQIEWAMACTGCYLLSYFASGLPLGIFETNSWIFIKEMKEYENNIHSPLCDMYLQCALNLMGESDGPREVLMGKATLDYDMDKVMDGSLADFPVSCGWFAQLMLSYYYGDYEKAAEMAVKHEDSNSLQWPLVWSIPQPFFRGLAYLAMIRKLQQRKPRSFTSRLCSCVSADTRAIIDYTRRAEGQVNLIRTYAQNRFINSFHLLKILEAEMMVVNARIYSELDIKRAYDSAIRIATRSGLRNDAAIAAERYAIHLVEATAKAGEGDDSTIGVYFDMAVDHYSSWGAHGKVQQIYEKYGEYMPERVNRGSSLVGSFSKARTLCRVKKPTRVTVNPDNEDYSYDPGSSTINSTY